MVPKIPHSCSYIAMYLRYSTVVGLHFIRVMISFYESYNVAIHAFNTFMICASPPMHEQNHGWFNKFPNIQ